MARLGRYLFILGAVVLCQGLVGWSLTAMGAPPVLWLGCALVGAYLLRVGRGGVVPALLWVTLLITVAVVWDVYPPLRPPDFYYRYWALVLLGLWGLGLGAVAGLGRCGEALGRGRGAQAGGLVGLGLGLGLGYAVYYGGGWFLELVGGPS